MNTATQFTTYYEVDNFIEKYNMTQYSRNKTSRKEITIKESLSTKGL